MANVAYILRKKLIGEDLYTEMIKLSKLLNVVSITKDDFAAALELKARDFEDALQYYCARTNNCEIIVTRNKKDFTFSSVAVLTPEEFLAYEHEGEVNGE